MKIPVIELNEKREYSDNLKPGIVEFEIIKAFKKISSNGNEMISLTLKCNSSNGESGVVFDNIINMQNCFWKNNMFCKSIGMSPYADYYEISEENLIKKTGRCKIKVSDFREGRMEVEEYLPKLFEEEVKDKFTITDDDIPF